MNVNNLKWYEEICELFNRKYDTNWSISNDKLNEMCEDLITKIYKLSDTVRELKDDLENYYNPKTPQELIEEQIGDYRKF
mgnify:FL=1